MRAICLLFRNGKSVEVRRQANSHGRIEIVGDLNNMTEANALRLAQALDDVIKPGGVEIRNYSGGG